MQIQCWSCFSLQAVGINAIARYGGLMHHKAIDRYRAPYHFLRAHSFFYSKYCENSTPQFILPMFNALFADAEGAMESGVDYVL